MRARWPGGATIGDRADDWRAGDATVIDNRTGERFELPIDDGAVRSSELGRQAGGLALYARAFRARPCVAARSRTSMGGRDPPAPRLPDRGAVRALELPRVGVSADQGGVADRGQYESWLHEIGTRNFVDENVKGFIEGFRYDARPMAMVAASVGALSSLYTRRRPGVRREGPELQVVRLLAKLPTLAAFSYRHLQGLPYVDQRTTSATRGTCCR